MSAAGTRWWCRRLCCQLSDPAAGAAGQGRYAAWQISSWERWWVPNWLYADLEFCCLARLVWLGFTRRGPAGVEDLVAACLGAIAWLAFQLGLPTLRQYGSAVPGAHATRCSKHVVGE